MRERSERRALIAAVAYALRQLRPLLRRIAAEKHQQLESIPDRAQMAVERTIEHLELSRRDICRQDYKTWRHGSP